MGNVNKCDLFIVGEQKAGTTYLYNYLCQQPKVCMSNVKEPNFFCKDLIKDSLKFHGENYYYDYTNLKDYHNLFDDFDKPVVGEATSVYLYSKRAAQEIYKYNSKAKVIIMLREPVSFLNSLHKQYLKETTEDVKDFMEAYYLTSERMRDSNIPKRVRSPSLVYYKERIKYANSIKRYLKYFPKKQIKVIIFEEFIKDTDRCLKEILQFLNIDPKVNITVEESNPHRVPKNKYLFYTLHNPKLKKIIKNIIPDRYLDRFKKTFNKLFLKEDKKEKPSEGQISKLKQEIRPEVKKLNELLNNDNLIKVDLIKVWDY
jgi:hypothetical protein